jgi:hypothetical protein
MTKLRCIFCALAAATLFFLSAAGAWAGELHLSIANGRVTLVADNVPVRTILTEWARIGQTKIVNAEKLSGAPVTLKLVDVPERQALDTILRSAAGYMAAPRATTVAGASQYDRILILASSRPTATGSAPAPTGGFPGSPRFQAPPPMVPPTVDADVDEEPNDEQAPIPVPTLPNQPGYMPNQPGPNPGAPPGVQAPFIPGQQQPGQVTAPVLTAPRPGQLPPPQQPSSPGQRPIP